MEILLTKVYMGNMLQHPPPPPPLIQNVCDQLLRAQAIRLMVNLYIINPYELRKEENEHGGNPP